MIDVLFYKGKGGLFSKGIRWLTRGPYSHVELKVSDHHPFSSSEADGGVRFADWIKGTPEKWERLKLPKVDPVIEAHMVKWCTTQVGKKYDWRGIVQFFAPHIRSKTGSKNRWYCSEIVMTALCIAYPQLLGIPVSSPNKLYKILVKALT